jgi:hypothetical protein
MRWLARLALPGLLTAVLFGADAKADTIPITARVSPQPNGFGLVFGMDGTWHLAVAYGRRFRNGLGRNFPLQIDAAYTQPLDLIPGYDGGRISGSVSGLVYAKNGFGATFGVGPDFVFSKDAVGKRFGFGAEVFARPGHWGSSGMIALDLSYRIGYATCIVHSAPVADLYGDRYPGAAPSGAVAGPQDGCIGAAAHRLRTGLMLAGGTGFAGAHLAGGFQYNPNIDGILSSYPLTAAPFYLEFGLQGRFR